VQCLLKIITKDGVISIVFRYERELYPTRWSNVRKGAIFGVFTGWMSLIVYIVYSVGFIFGSILMPYESHSTSSISDILVVSDSY